MCLKYLVVFVLFIGGSVAVWAQGQVVFNNRVLETVVAAIYGVEPGDPSLARHGNTAAGTPSGTQTYGGAPLAGSTFTAQLFGGPLGTATEYLRPLLPATRFRVEPGAGFVVAPAAAVHVPGVVEGERAWMQLRAWNNRGGTVSNWLQVLVDPTISRGESMPFATAPLGSAFTPPANLIGLESFNLATGTVPPPRVRINFQTNDAPVPPGYLPDIGQTFGERGNGFTYGWNVDNTAQARKQNATNSPDARFDTFIFMDRLPGSFWEMALSNGVYCVHLAAGDPLNWDSIYRIEAEGVLAVSGTPSPDNPWIEGDAVVQVCDGRLTIESGLGSSNNRLNFLEIASVGPPRLCVPTRADATTNHFFLRSSGQSQVKYQVEASEDFSTWQTLGLATNVDDTLFRFTDPGAAQHGRRFYRVHIVVPAPRKP